MTVLRKVVRTLKEILKRMWNAADDIDVSMTHSLGHSAFWNFNIQRKEVDSHDYDGD